MPAPRQKLYFATALACVLAAFLWQSLIVNLRYGGNWTALFCTASNLPIPPALAAEDIYRFPDSAGYDGEMYHFIAHDPLGRRGIPQYLDAPQMRYRRILLPAAAYLLAFGRDSWIDAAYIAANLLFLFLGAWWLSRYLDSLKLQPACAALLLLAPAMAISVDRLTVDLAFTALCIGFALYIRLERLVPAAIALMLACLCRDTGFILAVAACLALAVQRRWAKVALMAAAVVPAGAWDLWVRGHLDPRGNTAGAVAPFQGIVDTLLHPFAYPLGPKVTFALTSLDRLSIVGFLLAAVLSFWLVRRNGFGPIELAMVLWSCLGICLPRNVWEEALSGPRVFTPLLIYVALRGFPSLRWTALAPLLLILPRVLLQIVAPLLLALIS